jgi:hypothetical protein
LFKFYIISTVICLLVVIISTVSMSAKAKREGYKTRRKPSRIEVIRNYLPFLIPLFNIFLALCLVLDYEGSYTRALARCVKEGTLVKEENDEQV